MAHHIFSTDQSFQTSEFHVNPVISKAIVDADKLSEKKGCDMTVIRTVDDEICVLDYFGMKVLKSEIAEKVYSTSHGFVFSSKH